MATEIQIKDIPTMFPLGSKVRGQTNDKTYTVVGYLTKGGVIAGRMITIANDEGVRFFVGASTLEPVQ